MITDDRAMVPNNEAIRNRALQKGYDNGSNMKGIHQGVQKKTCRYKF